MRLVDTSSLDSRLHHSGKRVFARHPCFEPVFSCCLCQCCTHDSSFLLSPHFAHGSGAPGYSVLIHGSTLCRQLKSCLRDWSISRMKPCRQDNDKVQRTSTLGKPKTFTGQPAEWTTWQFTFKAFACATHARMRDVFELATRKGSDPLIISDMTVELQSLSTQLYYMLVMMLSDQTLEIVRNSPDGVGAEVWSKLLWEYEPGVGIRYGAMLHSLLKRRFGEHDETDAHERLCHSSVTSPSTSSSPVISSVMPPSTELCVEAWHTKV